MQKAKMLLITLSLVASAWFTNAQTPGSTCSVAITAPATGTMGVLKQTNKDGWLQFIADATSKSISLINLGNTTNFKIQKLSVLSGTCGSLTALEVDSITPTNDTLIQANVTGLIVGNTYFIKTTKQDSSMCVGCSPDTANFILKILCTNGCYFTWELVGNGLGIQNCFNPGTGLGTYTCPLSDACPNSTLNVGYTPCNQPAYTSYSVYVWTSGTPAAFNFTYSGVANGAVVPFTAVPSGTNCYVTYTIATFGMNPPFLPPTGPSDPTVCNFGIINVWQNPNASFTVSPNPSCVGLPVCFTGTPNCSIYDVLSYTVYNPATILTGSTACISLTAGTYTVNHNVSSSTSPFAGGLDPACTASTTQIFVVSPTPTVTAVASPTLICAGKTVTLTAFGASTYTWLPGGLTGSVIVVTPGVTTTYTVTGANAAGCTGTAVVTVSVNPSPIINIQDSPAILCLGNSTTLTASGANTYTWNTGVTTNTIAVSPTVTTNYTVTGTNAAGCTGTQTVMVIVNPTPTISITASSNNNCPGTTVTLTASGATNFTWSTGATNTISIVVSPTITTTYTVSGINSFGCIGTQTFVVTVLPVNPIATASPSSICTGTSSTLNITGLATFTWQPGGQTTTPIIVSPTVTTTYTVSGFTIKGCPGSTTVTVIVNPLPTISINASPPFLCSGNSTTLTASGANTYTWNTGATTTVIIVTPPVSTNYTVTGTSIFGCVSTQTVNISVFPSPTFTITKSATNICAGNSVTITLTPTVGVSYNTQPGGFTVTPIIVTPTASTIYTIVASAANGCTSTQTTAVNVVVPNVTAFATQSIICQGASTILHQNFFSPGTYTWMPTPGPIVGVNNIVVSPSVTTTYTICGFFGILQCPVCKTLTVVVNPTPTIVAIASPSVICRTQSSTLTASGATSFTWFPGAIPGSVITVSPNFSTTYTVLGTNGLCQSTQTVSLIVNPLPTVTVNSSTICPGNNAVLTASGAVSYSWSTGATTNPITVTPSVSTIYTVTGTNAFGCTDKKNAAVLVYTTNVTATASQSVLCAIGTPSTSLLFGTGLSAGTYSWNPGGLTGNPVSVSPTVTTTYTLSGTYSPLNCPGSQTVTVTIAPTQTPITVSSSGGVILGCVGLTTTLSTNITNTTGISFNWQPGGATTASIVVTPTDNINYTVTANGCGSVSASICVDITSTLCCAASSATLTNYNLTAGSIYQNIAAGTVLDIVGTLTINASCFWLNSTFRMASGSKIVINPSFTLAANNCTLFSCADMWEGIVVIPGSGGGGVAQMFGCRIEDAYKAVKFDAAPFGGYASNVQIFHCFLNKNYIGAEVLNCTSINSGRTDFTGATTTYTAGASNTSPGNSLKCSSFYTPAVVPRGIIGVHLDNTTWAPAGLVVGTSTSQTNFFDNFFGNLDNGVYIKESGIEVNNASFENITGCNTCVVFNPTVNVGTAIYAISNVTAAPLPTNRLYAQWNEFTDVWRGIGTFGMSTSEAISNTLTCTGTSISSCTSGCVGNMGITFNDSRKNTFTRKNIITNFDLGINANYTFLSAVGGFTFGIGQNTITATGSGFCNLGIALQDASNNFSLTTFVLPIAANLITNVTDGIYVNNVKGGARVSNNIINMLFLGKQKGIFCSGSQSAIIDNNTVSSSATSKTTIRGIYMQSSPLCAVFCNDLSILGQCLFYEGNNISSISGFYNNQFGVSKHGFVTGTNGQVGQQGSIGVASGNLWNGPFSFWTFTEWAGPSVAASAVNTPLWVNPGSIANPAFPGNLNATNGPPATDRYGAPNTVSVTLSPTIACLSGLTQAIVVINPPPAIPPAQLQSAVDTTYNHLINAAVNYSVYNTSTHHIHNKHTFGSMMRGDITTSDTTLINFYNANKTTTFGKYEAVDTLINNGQLTAAQSANSSAPITGNIDQNQKIVNFLLMKLIKNNFFSFTNVEKNALYSIANKCPLSDGNAVYQSRAILCIASNSFIQFNDSCSGGNDDSTIVGGRMANNEGFSLNKKKELNSFLLFPNPNNGNMSLLYTLITTENAEVKIFDVTGKLIYKSNINNQNNRAEINVDGIKEGIYYYKIENGNTTLKADKLVIIK